MWLAKNRKQKLKNWKTEPQKRQVLPKKCQTGLKNRKLKPKIDYIHHLEEEIAFLKEQIGKKDTEIERLTAGLLREQQLNYDLQNRLLEAPKQPDVSQDIAEPEPEPAQVIVSQPEPEREKRGFWRWLFNK